MGFQFALRSMILDDLTLNCYKFEFRRISRIWKATTVKRMKIDPYWCCDVV